MSITASWGRISAVVLRHLWQIQHDRYQLVHLFYWASWDIILWGFSFAWIQYSVPQSEPYLLSVMLTVIVGWQIFVRANFDIALRLHEEMESRNMTNLFSSPLRLFEWIIAVYILSLISFIMLITACISLVYLIYGYNILQIGWRVITLFLLLLGAGSAFGFFSSCLLMHYGKRIEGFIYIISWGLAPFSNVFYPITILPRWMQFFSGLFPLQYIMGSIRILVTTGTLDMHNLILSILMTALYTTGGIVLFWRMFIYSKERGFARLSD